MNNKDLAKHYQEKSFPGKSLIAFSVILLVIHWITVELFTGSKHELEEVILKWIDYIFIPAIITYFWGFWKGVNSKGQPFIYFLLSFTGIIGILVLYTLPNLNETETKNT